MLGLLMFVTAAAPPATWVGDYVMPRRDDVPLAKLDGNGGFDPFAELDPDDAYLVREEKDGRVRLRYAGKDGWALKDDLVPVQNAGTFFGDKVKETPEDAAAHMRLGLARSKLPKPDRNAALAAMSEAVKRDPTSEAHRIHRGWLYSERREYAKAVTDFTRAIELDDENYAARLGRGYMHKAQRHFDKAAADFDKAVELEPTAADGYIARGRLHAERKDFEKALAELDKAVDLDPEDPYPFIARGDIHLAAKDYKKAVADYDAALKHDPDDPDAHASRGDAHFGAKDYAKARADYAGAAKRDPHSPRPRRGVGDCLWRTKKYAESKAEYEAAIAKDPGDPDSVNALAWFLATCPGDGVRDGKRAVELATKAVAMDDSSNIRDTLAAAHAEAGDFDKAAAEQEKAMKMTDDADEIAGMKDRLAGYKAKKPHRDAD